MARLIYSFEHPIDNLRYFYFHNTYFETIETIPMDLSNFMWYYQSSKNNLNGFEDVYLRLKEKGAYLLDDSFSTKSKEEKEMLYSLVIHSGANEMAKMNQSISEKLDDYLSNTQDKDIILGTSTILRKNKFVAFRPLSFFASWHSMYDYTFFKGRTEFDNFRLKDIIFHEKEADLEAYAAHYLDLVQNYDMPISAIPHVVRNRDEVKKFLIENRYYTLLPFQTSELSEDKKVYKLSKKEATDNEINSFFAAVESCNYGIASDLLEVLENRENPMTEITPIEKREILKNILFNDVQLAHLCDEAGEEILPAIYTETYFNQGDSEGPYILFKYGIQTLDLFSKQGKLLFEEAYSYDLFYPYVFVTEHSMEIKIMKYSEETDMLYLMHQLKDNSIDAYHLFGKEGEGKIYFMNGFIDQDFELQSPFCFDKMKSNGNSEKCYSEGLAPVSLNGKWGFIDHSSNCVIPFEYGDAFPFKDGKAKVFKLNEKYRTEKGEWSDVPSFETELERFQMTEEEFQLRFPTFPKSVRKPLNYIRKRTLEALQLAMEYHSFENGVAEFENEKWNISYFGKWIIIDQSGTEIEQVIESPSLEGIKSIPDNYKFENTDPKYWIQKIIRYNYEVNNLPDHLYLNKEFIHKLIENCPSCFKHLTYLYSEDSECKSVYEEAIKQTKTEQNKANDSEIELIDDEDDLPF